MFLVTGNTKNVCDKKFNDLKRTFMNHNVYCYDDLLKHFNHDPDVCVYPVTYSMFYSWNDYLNKIYKLFNQKH